MQLSVVVAVISDPGPVDGLDPGGRGAACGRVQSVVVGVDRVREAGGQNHRAAPVQQQRLLAARPAGQDAVDAEHPGGHHTGTGTDCGGVESLKEEEEEEVRGPWVKALLQLRHGASAVLWGGLTALPALLLRELVCWSAGLTGTL